ncbi:MULTISPECIES: alginate O-acetyltransferase AlgX-related protein [Burkholderia]|uniref:alginate O-acetyltransferase AlgX-related protein n=1 Tax=Burkholderia TaxID=32008 RepID=UPI0009F73FCF|nr:MULTISPECIES: cell division protein FtsQ [unclassified Burkholderia]
MAACVLGLLAAGFALAIVTLVARGGSDPSFGIGTARDWRDGSQMQRIDRAIDVPYAHWLHRWQAALRYRLLGDLGPQVREGCPGWLFYADGLHPPPESAATQPVDAVLNARIAAMHRYAHALRRDGIALVVVTVPDKARVETQALCGLRQDPRIGQRWRAWQSALAQAGVAHVELTGALSAVRPAFYRTDVHWNARGAQAAARAVGDAVLPLVGGRGDTRFTLERGAAKQPRVGDLLALAGLGDVPDGWRPAPDDDVQETLHAERAGGLLDDGPPVQVLLAGSSFSRRSAFAERLGEALGREVWNESVDDGRFDRALAAMWTRRARWPASLRVVIWEMSEDALSAPPDAPTVMRSTAAAPAPGVTPGPAARPSAAPADAPRPRLLLSN